MKNELIKTRVIVIQNTKIFKYKYLLYQKKKKTKIYKRKSKL